MEVKVVGSIDDVNELEVQANPNRSAIIDVVAGNGHKDNASFGFRTNIKRFGTSFDIRAEDLRALAGGVRQLRTGEEHYWDVGAVVRTDNSRRLPGVLLHRFRHRRAPDVDFTLVNQATANDMENTLVLSVSNEN